MVDVVHAENGPLVVLADLHLVPLRVVQLLASTHDHRALCQVHPQAEATPDQLQLEELELVVVKVHQQGVLGVRFELEREGAVEAGLPGGKLGEGSRSAVQVEGCAGLQPGPQDEQEALSLRQADDPCQPQQRHNLQTRICGRGLEITGSDPLGYHLLVPGARLKRGRLKDFPEINSVREQPFRQGKLDVISMSSLCPVLKAQFGVAHKEMSGID